jgi:glycosyltransferase involved in cell wall biosynthesis
MIFPKISIIVPSYNQGQYLEKTILSIINQAYPDLELYIVDGGSTDDSIEIIKKYEQQISWWVSEKDEGQSNAINKGFSKISGHIVSWVNSDDLLLKGALHKVAEHFSSLPSDVGLIHGGTTLFDAKKDIKNDWGYVNPSLERNLAGMAFSQPSAFFLKKYLDVVGGKLNEQLHYGMDYDLFCRLACVCRFTPVNDLFSKYRLHDNSKSVKEQHKFINDWNCTFVNFCKNVGWIDTLEEMKNSGFFQSDQLSYYCPFDFSPDMSIIAGADRKQTLFYHFCYLLKAFYWNDERMKAKKILDYLKTNYNIEWIKNEKDVPAIMKKMMLPDFILKGLKKIKNSI